jgi:hypothetical protein
LRVRPPAVPRPRRDHGPGDERLTVGSGGTEAAAPPAVEPRRRPTRQGSAGGATAGGRRRAVLRPGRAGRRVRAGAPAAPAGRRPAEVMTVLVPSNDSGCRAFEHFHQRHVAVHLQAEFPHIVGYGRARRTGPARPAGRGRLSPDPRGHPRRGRLRRTDGPGDATPSRGGSATTPGSTAAGFRREGRPPRGRTSSRRTGCARNSSSPSSSGLGRGAWRTRPGCRRAGRPSRARGSATPPFRSRVPQAASRTAPSGRDEATCGERSSSRRRGCGARSSSAGPQKRTG